MMILMGNARRIYLSGLLAVATIFGFAASQAGAATIMADPVCCTFVGGPFVQSAGQQSVFDNPPESAPHNVTATALGPDGAALFAAETILAASSSPVRGSEYLGTGTYPFVCTLHQGMSGELVVDGSGTAVSRPSISLAVPSQKLKQVKGSGKVKVKVKAGTKSNGISIRLVKGKQNLSSPLKLNLPAGVTRTVSLKLNGAGKKAVRKVSKGKKFQVSVSGSVPFGKPAKASRSLR